MTQLPTHDNAAVINYQCKLKATVTSLILWDATQELDQLKISLNPFLVYQTTLATCFKETSKIFKIHKIFRL